MMKQYYAYPNPLSPSDYVLLDLHNAAHDNLAQQHAQRHGVLMSVELLNDVDETVEVIVTQHDINHFAYCVSRGKVKGLKLQ